MKKIRKLVLIAASVLAAALITVCEDMGRFLVFDVGSMVIRSLICFVTF